ncbi:MAG TPA: hypothetical protein VFT43_10600, partial [Candidatus Polarisedimenticolia bacterium]|nr:hypothetical protein [Candidatus Polarisedimenticolia bacterium]
MSLLKRCTHVLILPLLALLIHGDASAAVVSLTGKVTDCTPTCQNGAGIFGVQIGFVESCTGQPAGAINNITSSTGAFQTTVAAGIYDVEFTPPLGSPYTAYRLRDFDLTASRTLAPIGLPTGVVVSGRVTDAAGVGVAGTFVHFYPPGSSDRTFTVRDKTDASGNYSVVVAAGTYDVKYGPPLPTLSLPTPFLALVRPSVSISTNAALPTAVLGAGLLVSGTVLDGSGASRPVINVNLDAIDTVTGQSLFLSHDRSDLNGLYSLAIPPGTYRFEYKPEKCPLSAVHLLPQDSGAFPVAADLTLPTVTLAPGALVRGVVTDTRSTPVFDVNTGWLIENPPNSGTYTPVLTVDDHTNASG